ncbi:MAG: ATP phosphoribosyltransferase regulatory subunit [Cyanobacteria bacterium J06632_22]
MTYQPPSGARDLFPLDVAQKRWIDDRLEGVFHRWGYHRIITSTIENMETLMAGGAIQPSEVIELHDGHGGRLGLRPELTASIARAAVTRMDAVSYPQRLCYSANVFRRATGNQQQEYYQAGGELLGTQGMLADAEVLLLIADCLESLGLGDGHLLMGEASLTRSLLAPFPEEIRSEVRVAIATLDRLTLEALPADLRDYALKLLDLRGAPKQVLTTVSQFDLSDEQRQRVGNLKSLIELLEQVMPKDLRMTLDLSLIQPFDYYTGIVFEVISADAREVLAQGGRYDDLLSLYHPQGKGYPGVGFVLHIDTLQQVLLPSGQLPTVTPGSEWLIAPATPAAAAAAVIHAQKLRQSASVVRVELCLEAEKNRDDLRDLARQRSVSRIAWISEDGTPDIEVLYGGTTL